VHLATGWVLMAAIAVHVSATFYHEWVLHDRLLWRMWPWRRKIPGRTFGARSPG
jgi:cytochrome b561